MAQLPSKFPTMTPSFSYKMTSMPASASQRPNWVDEFLDFSSMRRSVHPQSVNDPIAFIEECRDSNNIGFLRLDDEQFSNDITTPSDENSHNDFDPKTIPAPAPPSEQQPKNEPCFNFSSDVTTIVDPKRTEVSALSPRVAFFDHQRLVLNVDNNALKQRIVTLAQDKIFKDAHQEALKEIERLRRVYHEQNMQMGSHGEEESATVTVENDSGCAAEKRNDTEGGGLIC